MSFMDKEGIEKLSVSTYLYKSDCRRIHKNPGLSIQSSDVHIRTTIPEKAAPPLKLNYRRVLTRT